MAAGRELASEAEATTEAIGPRCAAERGLLLRSPDGTFFSRNAPFSGFVSLVEACGFRLQRTSGGHHIFVHPDLPELLNLQDVRGEAKPYQIRQFLRLVERYALKLED